MEILLNKHKSKKSTNINNSIPIKLKGRNRILPLASLNTTINEIDLYNKERLLSNVVRLTCTINPICTNVLFNPITEIVKGEGSDECACLNFSSLSENNSLSLVHKTTSHFQSSKDAIRDTQLSNNANGFQYHCGYDIFNNHILRSQTFKSVCKVVGTDDVNFNTLFDFMRSADGQKVGGYKDTIDEAKRTSSGYTIPNLHLYLAEDVLTFEECVDKKLTQENGWYGFTNVGKMITDENMDIFKVINNRKPCDFIDMYPSRDLWYFTPKYNSYRKRIEKNWDYCLTYPSSSTTNVDFIDEKTNALKACMFDDVLTNSIGTSGLKIYSISKHGLSKGDIVNIYANSELVIRNTSIVDVEDEYTFSVYDNGIDISSQWYQLTVKDLTQNRVTIDGKKYGIADNKKYLVLEDNDSQRFPLLPNNRVCLEDIKVSFKRVVDGNEVEYYVRIFSKIPNWRFVSEKPSEYAMYKKDSNLISEFQKPCYDFENHVSKLAYAKNIYGDDISEVVFTDDIDLSYLKDNLGRPLSEIYFTTLKTNIGYNDWYNGQEVGNAFVEYSHCFGPLSCAFRLSDYTVNVDEKLINSTVINKKVSGLSINNINDISSTTDEIRYRSQVQRNYAQVYNYDEEGNEELVNVLADDSQGQYEGDKHFYGDLCCYATSLLEEQSIQMIDFRFNTYQREYPALISNKIFYDEIDSDDYDKDGFSGTTYEIINGERLEGYCYTPHYKIPIHTYSDKIKTERPIYIPLKDVQNKDGRVTIVTHERHHLNVNDIIYLKTSTRCYTYMVENIVNERKMICIPTDGEDTIKAQIGRCFIASANVPSYATLSKEGSCTFMWRDLIKNGFDTENKVEQYPFMNNALYVHQQINLFVRRQDPEGKSSLLYGQFPKDIEPNKLDVTNENNYFEEEDIEC